MCRSGEGMWDSAGNGTIRWTCSKWMVFIKVPCPSGYNNGQLAIV